MTRIVPHTPQAPQRIPLGDIQKDLYLCRCGLSANGAFCDGSHKRTHDETPGALYAYSRSADGSLHRIQLTVPHLVTPGAAAGTTPIPVAVAPVVAATTSGGAN